MSLLHKNGILKEYRRQHREEVATQQAALEEEVSTTNGGVEDEFPDVAAFQFVGGTPSPSPSTVRPSQMSVMSTMGEGNSGGATASPTPRTKEDSEGNGETDGRAWPPTLTIRTSFPDGGVRQDEPRQQKSANTSKNSSPVHSSRAVQAENGDTRHERDNKGNNDEDNNGVDEADEFVDLDHFSSPLAPPQGGGARGAVIAVGVASPRTGAGRSHSDLTGEEDRAAKGSHLHSPGTDPSVSPTTLTAGVDTFLSAADAGEGLASTYGVPLRAKGGGTSAPSNPAINNGSTSRGASSTGGLPLSPSSSKPQSPVVLLTPPPVQVDAGQRHGKQGSGEAEGHGAGTVDVSSSSSTAAVDEASGEATLIKADEKHTSMMSVETVERMGSNKAANSLEGETSMTDGSPGPMRRHGSDTMFQPPTSILSEPSTLDTTTANLATLRSRSHARRAQERAAIAGKQGYNITQPTLQGPHHTSQTTTNGVPADAADKGEGEGNNDDEDVFSRVSVSEYVDGAGSPMNGAPSLIDTRVAIGPSNFLSFSGTARTFPRIGEDEDVDVDPSSTLTDLTIRTQLAAQPITFYSAYLELIKDMKLEAQAKIPQQGGGGGGGAASATAAPVPAPAATKPAHKAALQNKKSGFLSLFGCCGPHESDVETRQPPAYARAAADLDRVGASSSVPSGGGVAASASEEEDLRAVHFLKGSTLSLQNSTHRRMLYTVFNVLTGQAPWPHQKRNAVTPAKVTPPSSSTRAVRWEMIGFQGSNPATDVRATGVLGVLQLLYLLDYYPAFAKRLWDLCQNPNGAPHRPGGEAGSSPPRTANGISNQLPFVLVCFNFTAVVLDAAGQHVLDADIRKARRSHMASATPMAGSNAPEAHLAACPGTFVCCEAFVGALMLFGEAWSHRSRGRPEAASSASSSPPLNRPSIADFGDIKAKLRAQIVRKGGATLLHDAVEKVRGETLLGFE